LPLNILRLTLSSKFYNKNASNLADLYLSKSFDQVHSIWSEYLQAVLDKPDARILDIGAGAGRDSKRMAELGRVNNTAISAIEPAQRLAELGEKHTSGLNVQWLQDSLPSLSRVTQQEISFDLILLSAVWMHIPGSAHCENSPTC
jgi:2-polyprenyl-3-methyl-5-hydroxy-6-metoxy-1,4-benzoquinol methylase